MTDESNEDRRNSQTLPGGLYLVATPIGNLADITLRALEVLKGADVIACEDTRVSGKLLSYYGIKTRTLSYHEHNAEAMRPRLMEALQAGKVVALISDAGTPLISDPGYKLVCEAAAMGLRVFPVPGASSVMAALCASGLPTNRFLFAGFLPTKESARASEIEELSCMDTTLVFFEAARRLPETLAALARQMPSRHATVAREITKLYEEFRRATLEELAAHYAQAGEPRGEVVIVIGPPQKRVVEYNPEVESQLREALQSLSVKDAASQVARRTGIARHELYTKALDLKGK